MTTPRESGVLFGRQLFKRSAPSQTSPPALTRQSEAPRESEAPPPRRSSLSSLGRTSVSSFGPRRSGQGRSPSGSVKVIQMRAIDDESSEEGYSSEEEFKSPSRRSPYTATRRGNGFSTPTSQIE
mmetsp:Transcript_117058/g.207037  ORF Transcript_117058/g.207037 Transcript_117058/m.207037 type:complete len:125 (+) Transcript_117058:2-376(+)